MGGSPSNCFPSARHDTAPTVNIAIPGGANRRDRDTNQAVAIRRRRKVAPTIPKPLINKVQLAGSGTAFVTA